MKHKIRNRIPYNSVASYILYIVKNWLVAAFFLYSVIRPCIFYLLFNNVSLMCFLFCEGPKLSMLKFSGCTLQRSQTVARYTDEAMTTDQKGSWSM